MSIDEVVFHDDEVAAFKECSNSAAQEQRSEQSVDDQTHLECFSPQEVAKFVLKLIADSLYDECEQDYHPQPVGTAERCGIEQREGCKEGSSEGDECSECKFPFPTCRVDDEAASFFCISQ